MRRRPLTSTLLLTSALAACGGSDADPGGGNLLAARFDGEAWTAEPNTIVASGAAAAIPGSLGFQGGTNGPPVRNLAFGLGRIPGPGVHPLGVNPQTATGGTAFMLLGTQSWSVALDGSAGEIEFAAIGEGRARGTFHFEVRDDAGAVRLSVTEGRFDVPLSPEYRVPSAEEAGSVVRATIGGAPWNAATVTASERGSSLRGFSAGNTRLMLTMTAGPIEAPEEGPLTGPEVPVRHLRVREVPSGQAWGGTAADTGTLTFTSVSEGRIAGRFEAVLAPSLGGSASGPLVIEGGSFDVRLAD